MMLGLITALHGYGDADDRDDRDNDADDQEGTRAFLDGWGGPCRGGAAGSGPG